MFAFFIIMNAISLLISLELDTTDFSTLSKDALIRIEKQMQLERKLNPDIPTGLVAQTLQMIINHPQELHFFLSHGYFRDLFAGTFNTVSKPKQNVSDSELRYFLTQFFEQELLEYAQQMLIQERFFTLTVLMKYKEWLPETVIFEIEKKLSIKIDFATYQIHEKGSQHFDNINYIRKKDFYDLLSKLSSLEMDQKVTMLLNITVDKYNPNTANSVLRITLLAMTNYVAYDDTLQNVLNDNRRRLGGWTTSSTSSSDNPKSIGLGKIILYIWLAFILVRFIVFIASSSNSKSPEIRMQENKELNELNKVFYDQYQKKIQNNKYQFMQYLVMYDSVKPKSIVYNDSLRSRMQVFTSAFSQPNTRGSDLELDIEISNQTSYDIIILMNLYIPNRQNMPKENALIKAGDVVKIKEFPINIFAVQFYIGKKLASFESKNQHDYFQAYTQKPEWRFLELYPHSQTTISQMFYIQGSLNFTEKEGKIILNGKGLQKIDVNNKYQKIESFVFE
jgi:hypothetical protein